MVDDADADGHRRATTLSADGRVDELVWGGGTIRRRALGRVALPAGERGVGVVMDGARGLVVATARAGEATFEQTSIDFTWQSRATTRLYRATLPSDGSAVAATPIAPWLDVEVEGSGPDLRVCSGSARPATTGWTLGGAAVPALAAGPRCVVLVRPVPAPTTLADTLAVRVPSDAFVAEGELPGIGRALVTVRAVDPTPMGAGHDAASRPLVARGAHDRGFADGRQEAPRATPAGLVADAGGGRWSLSAAPWPFAPAPTCDGDACATLVYTDPDGRSASVAVASGARLVADPDGGVIVAHGVLADGVLHVATDLTRSALTWPVPRSDGVERFVVASGRLWRCAVGARTFGDLALVDGVACATRDGQAAAGPRCGSGLACDVAGGDDGGVDREIVTACGGRVRFDPETRRCALGPAATAAPHDVAYALVEADGGFVADDVPLPDGGAMHGAWRPWRIERAPENGAAPVVVASGYRAVRTAVGDAPLDPSATQPLALVIGREALAVLEGDRVVARVIRDDHDSASTCGGTRCAPSAVCVAGQCQCPPGTTGPDCLGPAGSDVAPAPSCAAVGHAGPALVDPDGLAGGFPAVTVDCADVAGLGLAASGAGPAPTPASGPPSPDGPPALQPYVTLFGAFEVRATLPGSPVAGPALALDPPDFAPTGDGLTAWTTTAALAPGRFALATGRDPQTNQVTLEVHDGLTVTSLGDYPGEVTVRVRRDDEGTLRVLRDDVEVYARATGKLPPLRLAAGVVIDAWAWAGSACARADSAWPASPAVCACTPVDCRARRADCGPVDDGCGQLQDCGGCASTELACGDNACGCARDASEAASGDPEAAHDLGTGYAASFAGTFHDASDVDAFTYASPLEQARWSVYHVTAHVAAAAGATFDLTVEGRVPGTFCTLACPDGESAATSTLAGGTACRVSGTTATLVIGCVGFDVSGATLGVSVAPHAWDESCVPYTLDLTVVAQ